MKRLFVNDHRKRSAIDYVEQIAGDFWAPTDERVKQIVDEFREQVETQDGMNMTLGGSVGALSASANATNAGSQGYTRSLQQKFERKEKYQKIVNQNNISKLNEMMALLHNHALDSRQHFTYLLIDDLDKDWVEESIRIRLIRSLFEAVVDMSTRVDNLKILVALRSNIFLQLDYASQRLGLQEEKVADMLLELRWSEDDLSNLLEQRVSAASAHYDVRPPVTLEQLLPNVNSVRGNPVNFILRRTLQRPRDAISFLNIAIRQADGRRKLSWDHIHGAEEDYSKNRLNALRDEWKDPFFDLDKLFPAFRKRRARMSKDEFAQVLDDIASFVLGDTNFKGEDWLTPLCQPVYSTDTSTCTWFNRYGELAGFFFNIGLIGFADNATAEPIYSYNWDSPLVESDIGEASLFVIHPAFRKALETKDPWSSELKG